MTPPRRETDFLDGEDTPPRAALRSDVTPILSAAEASAIAAMQRAFVDSVQPVLQGLTERVTRAEAVAEQSSASATKPARSRDRWRLVAVLLGAVTTSGGVTCAGLSSVVQRYDETIQQKTLADHEAKQLDAATAAHLATAHQDPAAAAELAQTLDKIVQRLEGIEERLDRLEARRR